MQNSSIRIRASRWLRFLKRFQLHTRIKRGHGAGQVAKVAIKAFAVENLGHEAAVGQRGSVAVTVDARCG